MDANAPILFFDSGVGGLSVLEPTLKLLPNAPIVYAADSAGFPYGKRSEAEIASRVPALLGRLVERFHPRLVVLACTHFPLLAEELSAAYPDVHYVDGGEGIARRIAWLTRDQAWPSAPSQGLMLFTSAARTPSLTALARYGIGEIRTL